MATKQQLYDLRNALNDIIASIPDDVVAEVATPIEETPEAIAEEAPAAEPTEDTPALDDAGGDSGGDTPPVKPNQPEAGEGSE